MESVHCGKQCHAGAARRISFFGQWVHKGHNSAYVLPHKTKFASDDDYQLAGGPKGWNYHQGIYVYRNKRLIICGTWFDYIKKEPAYNLARIKNLIYHQPVMRIGKSTSKNPQHLCLVMLEKLSSGKSISALRHRLVYTILAETIRSQMLALPIWIMCGNNEKGW